MSAFQRDICANPDKFAKKFFADFFKKIMFEMAQIYCNFHVPNYSKVKAQ